MSWDRYRKQSRLVVAALMAANEYGRNGATVAAARDVSTALDMTYRREDTLVLPYETTAIAVVVDA
ncbi:hypothetical protein BH24CHL3_BH24CHL3_07270 [soil metagenome]